MTTSVEDRTLLTCTTDEGNPAVLSLHPVTGGLEVSVDISAGLTGASATSTWCTKVLTDLTAFFVDPESHGAYATVWRGRVPAAGISVKPDGTLAISVLDHGFGTVILHPASAASFRRLLKTLSV